MSVALRLMRHLPPAGARIPREASPVKPAEPAEPAGMLDFPRRRPLMERGLLRRRRPLPGGETRVLVQAGRRVSATDALALVVQRGRPAAIDVAGALGVPPARAIEALQHASGEEVAEGDTLAVWRAMGGLQQRTLYAPFAGRIGRVSSERGVLYLEPFPTERPVVAHLAGTVVSLEPAAAVIEGPAVAIAGLAGAGPAAAGVLMVAESPGTLPPDAGGCVVACPFALDEPIVQRLVQSGARAVVAAGIEADALARLGWEEALWPHPAAPGHRPALPLTVVLLAPGQPAPAPAVWEALQSLAGRQASALGWEPGCSPELLVSLAAPGDGGSGPEAIAPAATPVEIVPGARVRVLAGSAAGLAGDVVRLIDLPYVLPSEVRVEVAEVAFPGQGRRCIPLTHLQRL